MASVTDYTGGEVFPTGSFPWRALKQIFLLGCLRRSYSPKCLVVEFSEIRYPLATPSNNKNTPCGRCAKSYTHV
jgi:hypothetical protein